MKATVGYHVSIQVEESVHKALEGGTAAVIYAGAALGKTFEHTAHCSCATGAAKLGTHTIAKSIGKTGTKATTKAVAAVHYSCNSGAVKFGTDALAKPAAKCSAKAGTKAVAKVSAATTDVTTETVFQLGYTAALSGTAIGIIAGVAVAINIAIEGPLLARSVYKLHRKKKFDQISKVEFERGIVQESITSANAVAGAVVGAVVGQAAIPVPVLGAAVGGGVGGAVGQLCGRVEGLAIGKVMFEPRAVTLPPLVKTSFIDNPPPGK